MRGDSPPLLFKTAVSPWWRWSGEVFLKTVSTDSISKTLIEKISVDRELRRIKIVPPILAENVIKTIKR